jgi:hypothetical protein
VVLFISFLLLIFINLRCYFVLHTFNAEPQFFWLLQYRFCFLVINRRSSQTLYLLGLRIRVHLVFLRALSFVVFDKLFHIVELLALCLVLKPEIELLDLIRVRVVLEFVDRLDVRIFVLVSHIDGKYLFAPRDDLIFVNHKAFPKLLLHELVDVSDHFLAVIVLSSIDFI